MKITRFGAPAALALVGALALSACGGQQAAPTRTGGAGGALSGTIASDGSSTVGR